MSSITEIIAELADMGNADIAHHSQRFFQAFEGGYGQGDQFYGVRVPKIRKVAAKHKTISLNEVLALLKHPVHEVRLLAVIILTLQFAKAGKAGKQHIYESYLAHHRYINNWDIVDASCHKIVGAWLHENDHQPLYELTQKPSVWQRRVAIVSTYYFIKRGQLKTTFGVSEMLLNDPHDLIHKACGWMLREAGKQDVNALRQFLTKHSGNMPRMMLRYAIERFPQQERQHWLAS